MIKALIDSHIHFWEPSTLHYDWLTTIPALNRPFVPADLAHSRHKPIIKKRVFVQADCRPEEGLDEVAWVTQLAQTEPTIQGIVAFAPLEQGAAVRPHLDQLVQNPLVKGVRRLIQSEPLGFATQPAFIEAVKLLSRFDLSFDLCVIHSQLKDVIALVEQCPTVSFVLDHIGKPNIKEQQFEPWAADITTLASFDHVHCKLSGLVTEANVDQWTIDDLRPYAEHILNTFGTNRVMFGSDWPVCTLAADYDQWVDTAIALTTACSPIEQEAIFYQNAQRFYKLRNGHKIRYET